MPTLRKSRAKDAQGKPLEPDRLYTPISPHGRGFGVYNPGVELRGAHDAVQVAPSLWIAVDASTDEKGRALRDYRAAREAAQPMTPAPPSTRILGPIPRDRRRVAVRSYHDRSGRIVHEGSIWDANDDFVKANPDMFGPEAA